MKCVLCDKPMVHLDGYIERCLNPEVKKIISTWSCDRCKTLAEVQTTVSTEKHWEAINEIYGRTDL